MSQIRTHTVAAISESHLIQAWQTPRVGLLSFQSVPSLKPDQAFPLWECQGEGEEEEEDSSFQLGGLPRGLQQHAPLPRDAALQIQVPTTDRRHRLLVIPSVTTAVCLCFRSQVNPQRKNQRKAKEEKAAAAGVASWLAAGEQD